MTPKVEIILTGGLPSIISGNTNATAAGVLDLFDSEPIQLNMSCADIKDIKARKSTFSQSFVLPGTANNNTLFNFIFEIGSDSQFDPRKKTPCQLLVDTIPVMTTGNLQLTGIIVDDDKNISYEVSIFDETVDLVDALGSKELDVLDYTDMDHIWDGSHIVNSWTGSSQPYFYPLIDYGYGLNETDLTGTTGVAISQMFPAIQAKTIWDKIFNTAGYQYQSSFLDSTYFKNLYIPFNGSIDTVLSPTYLDQFKFVVQMPYSGATGFTEYLFSFPGAQNGKIGNPDHTSNLGNTPANFPNPLLINNNYNFTTNKYTASGSTSQKFHVNLKFQIPYPVNLGVLSDSLAAGTRLKVHVDFYRDSYMNGTQPFDIVWDQIPGFGINYNTDYNIIFSNNFDLNQGYNTQFGPTQIGENFWAVIHVFVHMYHYQTNTSSPVDWHIIWYSDPSNNFGTFYNTLSNQIVPNIFVPYNTWIPKKIKQIDYVNSIMTMHNLYVITDQDNPKKLIIEPRDDYYSAGQTKDWSNKLDLSKKIHQALLSEQQNNRIIFTYKLDKDYYNTDYNTSINRVFGDEYVNMNNDFTKDDKKIEIIFSPTPSVPILETKPLVIQSFPSSTVNDFVIPNIVKVDANGSFGRTDSNIRILQKNTNNLIKLGSNESWKLAGTSYTSYPYLGMLNHPFSGDTDIAFGTVEYEYYSMSAITPYNLVNKYYRKYLDQIIDKNGKLITANFYLTPADIQAFKFNNIIFVDGLSNGTMGDYFLVNSIKYSPTANGTSEVELIQLPDKQVDVIYTPIKRRTTSPKNIINLGNNYVNSVHSGAIGDSNLIGEDNWGIFALGKSQLIYGGGSHNILSIGSGTTIGGASINDFVVGDGNSIGNVNNNVLIFGNSNFIDDSNTNSYIYGDSNVINTGSTSTLILGSGNTIPSDLSYVVIFSSGITATTSNTLYVDNIQMSSGSTINGIPVSAITLSFSGTNVWTSGSTGNYSIKAINPSIVDATGDYSVAQGFDSRAFGIAAHAEGFQTISNGQGSHSEGTATTALSANTHAEGQGTTAGGTESHAEGLFTIAQGIVSHAEGGYSTAVGDFSHAEGSGTTSFNINSHAEGEGSKSLGYASHAEGYITTADGLGSHSEGYLSTASGFTSHAEGNATLALGSYSHAEGQSTTAAADYTHAEGQLSRALGQYSHAEGFATSSSGLASHAEGNATKAIGNYSHVEGQNCIATGQTAHAEGDTTTAYGDHSHAEGFQTKALQFGCHSQGQTTIASGIYSHAEGDTTTASGPYSHAEGGGTTASGTQYAHAEGNSTVSAGDSSHSEGRRTTASGDYSHAGGNLSTASGHTSFVHGSGSTAGGIGTIVLGHNINGSVESSVYVSQLILKSLTSTEEGNIVPANGMLIYNTTLNKFRGYENGAWVNLV